jgi:hypothetical protein
MKRLCAFLAIVAAALVTLPGAQAAHVSTLSIAPRVGHPAQLSLVARLASSSAGARVAFFVVSKEFGEARPVPIGVAAVGKDGTARIGYSPTWSGEQRFIAKLSAKGANAPSATAEYRVRASTPGPLYAGANPGRPLASVGHVFLDIVLAVVAAVWLSLLVTLALAFGRLPRLAGERAD